MMSSKLTSYQKLKLENAKLKSDIYTLVHYSNSIKADEIRIRESIKKGLVDAVWFGSKSVDYEISNGIYNTIFNNTEKDIM